MRIQHNIMAMSSYRNYTNNVSAMQKNLEKLSSGYKVNRAGDDAAGLAISEKMRAQITGLKQAKANAKSGINLVQTAEGALQEVQDMLNRMVKLAEQSANGTYDDKVDRNQLQKEFEKLTDEINRINQSANFNGKELFGGAAEATGGAGAATSPLEAAVDQNNAAKLGAVTVAFADDATDEQKAALNKALAGDFKFTTVDEGDGAWGAGDTIKIDKLPTGYTAKTKAQDGTTDITVAANTALTTGTGNDKIDATKDLAIDLYDAQNKKVATITVGKPTAGANGDTTVTFKEAAAAGGKAKAADATGGADAAKGPTFTESTTVGSKLSDLELASIDLSGVKTITKDTAAADLDVKIAYDGASHKFTVKVGGKTYEGVSASAKGTGNETIELTVNGDTGGATNGKITIKTIASTTKVGNDSAAADNIAEKTVGKAAPAAENTKPNSAASATSIGSYNLQIGDTSDPWNKITVNRYSIGSANLKDISEGTNKVLDDLSVGNEDSASEALTALKGMVNYISDIRGELGATQNRLDHTINNLSVMEENIQDAESTIRDTDVAEEMMAYTKNNILIQSAQAMLAQANQVPQGVLQLLQ